MDGQRGLSARVGVLHIEKGLVPNNLPIFQELGIVFEKLLVLLWSFYCRLIVPAFSQQTLLRLLNIALFVPTMG